MRIGNLGGYALVVATVLLLWMVLTHFEIVREAILPRPLDVLRTGWEFRAELWPELRSTVRNVAIAVVSVWLVGLVLAALFARTVPSGLSLVRIAYSFPIIAIFPIIIIWFGYGATGRIVYAFAFGLPPMILSAAAAIRSVEPQLLTLFRSLGASRAQTALKALLPASVSGVLGAMRSSGALALVGVVTGELLASDSGVGYWITQANSHFDMKSVYAGIVVIVVLAALLHIALSLSQAALERRGLA